MLYTTCHDWLVDSNLLLKELAESNDVSSSIKISVQNQPTIITFVPDPLAVGLSDLTTVAASLAGVFGVDMFNALAESLSLVFEELLELPEAPSAQESVKPLTLAFAFSDAQLLDNEELCVTQSYLLADTVVDISHKPLFSSTELPEMPLCRTSAFALELRFEPLVFTFDSTNLSAVEKLSITRDDWIDNPSINSKSFDNCDFWHISMLGYHIEDSLTIFDTECCSSNLPIKIGCEVGRNFERQFNSAECCGYFDNTFFQEGFEGIVVEPNGRQLLFDWQSPELFTFEHVTCLVASSCYETAIQTWPALSNSSVGSPVKLQFVVHLQLEAFNQNKVTSSVISFDSPCDSLVVRQDQFDCSLHNPLFGISKNKNHYIR